jgi:hypothetical protein
MHLPNGDRAIIDEAKLTEYCLNFEHEDGQHKARLFEKLLGITLENADVLSEALRDAAIHSQAIVGRHDDYGQRYTVDFALSGPYGSGIIRSAWIIRTGEDVPRLVTCYII